MNTKRLVGIPVIVAKRWGFVNTDGDFTIPPSYEELGMFSEGFASFRRNGKIGFLNEMGDEVIEPVFEPSGGAMPEYSGGVAAVHCSGCTGYIDGFGTWLIPPRFGDGFDFMNGFALVSEGKEYEVIALSGTVISRPAAENFPYRHRWPGDWSAFVGEVFTEGEKLMLAFDQKGRIVLPPRYSFLGDFCNGVTGFSLAGEGNLFGLIRADGTILKDPSFTKIAGFSEGVAVAAIGPKEYGFINQSGDFVIHPRFHTALSFREGRAAVGIAGKWGFIDNCGLVVVDFQYRRIGEYRNGHAWVESSSGQAIIDLVGNVIWES